MNRAAAATTSETPKVVVEELAEAPPAEPNVPDKIPSTAQPEASAVPISELLKSGQTEIAIARLEELLRSNPNNQEALLTLAGLYAKDRGRRDKAEQLLRKVLESDPENRETLEKYLNLQHDSRRPGTPLESLRRLMEENPDSPSITGAYARSLADKGQYAEAIALFERATENPTADALAYSSLAEYYRRTGQPGKAAEVFEKAIKKQEDLLADRKGRGLSTTDLERSLKELREQLERARNS